MPRRTGNLSRAFIDYEQTGAQGEKEGDGKKEEEGGDERVRHKSESDG